MNSADLMRYKWRAISYFGAAAFPATCGALAASITKGPLTGADWVIAVLAGVGSGFVSLRGLFDQKVDTSSPSS